MFPAACVSTAVGDTSRFSPSLGLRLGPRATLTLLFLVACDARIGDHRDSHTTALLLCVESGRESGDFSVILILISEPAPPAYGKETEIQIFQEIIIIIGNPFFLQYFDFF